MSTGTIDGMKGRVKEAAARSSVTMDSIREARPISSSQKMIDTAKNVVKGRWRAGIGNVRMNCGR